MSRKEAFGARFNGSGIRSGLLFYYPKFFWIINFFNFFYPKIFLSKVTKS